MITQFSSIQCDRGSGRDEVKVFHLVTLIHRQTGQEQAIVVGTATDAFCDVQREVCHQRAVRGLLGWEIFEAVELTLPF